jgi:hypothetical protein
MLVKIEQLRGGQLEQSGSYSRVKLMCCELGNSVN